MKRGNDYPLGPMYVTKLYERVGEMEQLSELLGSAQRGTGQTCVIEGPSGVGKSRLLDECAEAAQTLGMVVLRARGSELTRDFPFGTVRQLFEAKLLRADAVLRDELMSGPAVSTEAVFRQEENLDELKAIHGLYWLAANVAQQCPTAILVDDLPWTDECSQRFLAYLAERLRDLPIAVVVTIRSGDPGADSQPTNHLWQSSTVPPLRLVDFTENGVRALLTDALSGMSVDEDTWRTVIHQTSGNPFLVVATANAIRAGENPGQMIPESVRRSIARRLVLLTPAARDLARAAAVLGGCPELREAARLAGLASECGVAAAEELIVARFAASAVPFTFVYPIVGLAIYSLMAPGDRRQLHAQAAKLLSTSDFDAEVIADHLLRSGPINDAWASAVLHDAARAAGRKNAPAAALRYLRQAVTVAPAGELHPRVLVDVGLAEADAGDPASLDRFELALRIASEPGECAEVLYSQGKTLYRFGRYAEAGVSFRRGAQLLTGGNEQTRHELQTAACSAELHLEPTKPLPASLISGDKPVDRAGLAVAALRQAFTTPPASDAAFLATRALGVGPIPSEGGSDGPSGDLAILALLQCGLLREANDAADAAMHHYRERGAKLAYAEVSVSRAMIHYARGRVVDAAADAETAVDILLHREHSHAQTALAILTHCMIERGELQGAVGLLGGAAERLAVTPAISAYVRLARARLHICRRNLDAARADLDAVRDALGDQTEVNPTMLPWRSLAGVLAHMRGDDEQSRRLIGEEITLAQSFGLPIPLGVALRRRASTESNDRALASFREAIGVLRETEATLELARVHAGLGRGLRRGNQRVAAREHLRIGLDLAHRCGATGLEAEVRQELTVAGGRPRRRALSGVESLTQTELRVAHLAAEGLSNTEAAAQAFVSRNTIAWHLRNIYRKLDVDSRQQLKRRIFA